VAVDVQSGFSTANTKHAAKAGEVILMAARKSHAVWAEQRFKVCLIMIRKISQAAKTLA
jgi:hypothetical protein